MRVQARIEPAANLRGAVERHRQRWNPERASGNPAHVSVIYHDEAFHVTILHPDQGHRLGSAWPALSQLPAIGSMRVAEVVLVGGSNEIIDRFRLVAA